MVGDADRCVCEACQTIRSTMKPIFSTISTDMLYLRVAQTPRSPDLAIFVLTTDDDRLLNTYPLISGRGLKLRARSLAPRSLT